MEQLNTVLPAAQEEKQPNAGAAYETKPMPLLLDKVRQNFGIFGTVSLLFGGFFALLFYKSWIGLNVLLFSMLILILILMIMNRLSIRMKKGTRWYFAAVLLLGISSCYTSSGMLQFLNILGTLFLLDLVLLHQFREDHNWSFVKHVGQMFGLPVYSLASLGMPFVDSASYLKHTRFLKNDLLRNVFIGIAVSLPVLFVTTALLSSADLLFGEMTGKLFHFIFSADIFALLVMVLFGFLACYCILCGVLYKTGQEEKKGAVKADASIAITFMLLLCLVYAVFCGIQLLYLFAGGLCVLPKEFTFAEYARRGFFELLAVTVINIILMLICSNLFKENRILRILVTCMTACTYIMIASATYRMLLYIGAYQLTFLRLFVLLTLLIDAFVLAGVIISEYKKEFPLFRYCVAVISICYISFSFSRPDYYIASYLTTQKEMLTMEDMRYVTQELSLDAAPIVSKIINETDRWNIKRDNSSLYDYRTDQLNNYKDYVNYYKDRLSAAKTNIGIRDFNYSYYKAAAYMEKTK